MAAAASLLALAACGGGDRSGDPAAGPDDDAVDRTAAAEPSGQLTVFAAASLTDAFDEIGQQFEAANPGVEVVFNLASSSTLATQLVEGAPADVYASANDTQMAVVTDEGLQSSPPVGFVTNVLEIAVEAGNPLGISGVEDLAADDVVLVLSAPAVPAGRYADQMLNAEGVEVSPSSLEVDVRSTLAKVELGEADAAIVYRSDVVTASDAVEGVEIDADRNVSASYPIVPLAGAANPDAAEAFIAFVTGSEGQAVLERAGFTPP